MREYRPDRTGSMADGLTEIFSYVLQYGTIGGVAGTGVGWVGLLAASRRWSIVRTLTLPMKAFLVSSAGVGAAVIAADMGSQAYAQTRHEGRAFFNDRRTQIRNEEAAAMTTGERALSWARSQKYKIISLTWVASMIGSWMFVGRNPYLTGQQKLVQARVYAQGLTVGVLCATAAFEIHDQKQGRGILDAVKAKTAKDNEQHRADAKARYEGEDMWKDMVAAEEERLKDGKKE